MRKVIALRGLNGVGKSTACLGYIDRHRPVTTHSIRVCDTRCKTITVTSGAVFLGDYTRGMKYPGAESNWRESYIFRVLAYVFDEYPDRDVVIDSSVFNRLTSFTIELNDICEDMGYELVSVLLDMSVDEVVPRMLSRNGSKPVNVDSLRKQAVRLKNQTGELKAAGIETAVIGVRDFMIDDTRDLLSRYIR